jgi:hypothetical protein
VKLGIQGVNTGIQVLTEMSANSARSLEASAYNMTQNSVSLNETNNKLNQLIQLLTQQLVKIIQMGLQQLLSQLYLKEYNQHRLMLQALYQ